MSDDRLSLAGKVAVVTGAGSGLGRAEALALARAGADVVVNDLRPASATRSSTRSRRSGAKALFVEGDVGERATADALVAAATEHFGGLHVVVNNAGMTRDRMLFNMTDDEWDAVIRVHLRGHFLLSRNAAAYWRQQFKATGEPGVRPTGQHLVRGRADRLGGPAQLQRGQGRHRRLHRRRRARAWPGSACGPTRSARAPAPR